MMIMMSSIFTDTTVIRWPALMTMMIRECEAQQMPASVACVHLCYKALGHAQVKKKQFATSPMWSWWWHWCCTPVGHGKSNDWSGWLRTMVGHGWRFVWNLPIIKLNTFLKIRARKLWFMTLWLTGLIIGQNFSTFNSNFFDFEVCTCTAFAAGG